MKSMIQNKSNASRHYKKWVLFLQCGLSVAGLLFLTVPVQSQWRPTGTMAGNTPVPFDRSFLLNDQHRNVPVPDQNLSNAKAFFLSLALPGSGEYYAGSKKMGNFFLCTEAAFWAGYFSVRTYGNWKKQDYRLFAAAHAGVNPNGKNHQYFVDIENYSSIVDYNDAKLQQRRPGDRYPEDNIHYWKWDSEMSRKGYEKLRLSSDKAYHVSLLVIGGIVVNHIVSGIDAIRVAQKKERLNIQVGLNGLDGNGVGVTIAKRF